VKPFKDELTLMQSAVNLTSGRSEDFLPEQSVRLHHAPGRHRWAGHRRDSSVFYMNRAAEYAAPRSVPIFKNAITGMTITDGLALLNSSDSIAATAYLDARNLHPLSAAYTPIVDSTLALVPLTQYWGRFRTTYNSGADPL